MGHHHRSSERQSNRKFKGAQRNASKRSRKRLNKGKVGAEDMAVPVPTFKGGISNPKMHKNMIRKAKVASGIRSNAPRTVVFIEVTPGCDTAEVAKSLLQGCKTVHHVGAQFLADVGFERARLQFIACPRSLESVMDLGQVADMVAVVANAGQSMDAWGRAALTHLRSQGLANPVWLIHSSSTARHLWLKEKKDWSHGAAIETGEDSKVFHVADSASCLAAVRSFAQTKLRLPAERSFRPYMSAVTLEAGPEGSVALSGYVRGRDLDIHRLVHVPWIGTFQIAAAQRLSDPCPQGGKKGRGEGQQSNCANEQLLVQPDASKLDELKMSLEPDIMGQEQSVFTAEEMASMEKPRKMKPKGWSSYQASWLVDDELLEEGEELEVDGEEEDGMDEGDDANDDEMMEGEGIDQDESDAESQDLADGEDDVDDEQWERDRQQFLAELAEQDEDLKFPDEVDTPLDTPARTRFLRYRGLYSLRGSVWDPKEQLPLDYSRIFQLADFKHSRKVALTSIAKPEADDPQQSDTIFSDGSYVKIFLKGASQEQFAQMQARASNGTLVVNSLLKHENRVSICHFEMHRSGKGTEVIKNKDSLLLVAGPRRFEVPCLLSSTKQHKGSHGASKAKMLRFWSPGSSAVLTAYAPILFGPCPVQAYVRKPSGTLVLIGTGSIMPADPDRIVVKRVVLSGYPLRVHKKKAVVRYMFFNPDDVRWFRPVGLWTKKGRKGHIREPVGTHGHMKCVFDGPLNQQDTICMSLYKRAFPKWSPQWE